MVLAVVGSGPSTYEVEAEAQQPVRQSPFPLGIYHAQEHEFSPLPDKLGGYIRKESSRNLVVVVPWELPPEKNLVKTLLSLYPGKLHQKRVWQKRCCPCTQSCQ